jgi:hypothetical protein
MSDEKKTQIAKEYVDRQLETMKQYGSVRRELSKQEYDALVKKAAEMVRTS